MRVAVILNAHSGSIGLARSGQRSREIQDAFSDVGVAAELIHCEPGALTEAARRAAATGVDVVVAAGGDGTVSAVAAGLIGGLVPLGVLPLGTLNHFAREIGVAGGVQGAARVLAGHHVERVDVGEVNGHFFINNSSIGLYPEFVMSREQQRRQHGRGKWHAMLVAAVRVLRRFPMLSVDVATPGRALTIETPFVFVGNNEYTVELVDSGRRPHLDRGRLSLYTIRCTGRLRMFWLILRALLQRFDMVRDFEMASVEQVRVSVRRRQVKVALDGEVVTLRSPLEYRIRSRALPVIVAARQVAQQAEAA